MARRGYSLYATLPQHMAALGATLATGGDLPTGVRLAARAAALNSRLRGIDELEALATISF